MQAIIKGEIFYNSWGFEQTNIDFYQVVKVSPKSITFRAVDKVKTYSSDISMSGKCKPFMNRFKNDKTIIKRLSGAYSRIGAFKMDYGFMYKYEEPLYFSECA